MIPIKGSKFFLDDNDPNVIKVTEKHGKDNFIEAVWGTSPRLQMLKPNQKVAWGDGETYHFRLTKK